MLRTTYRNNTLRYSLLAVYMIMDTCRRHLWRWRLWNFYDRHKFSWPHDVCPTLCIRGRWVKANLWPLSSLQWPFLPTHLWSTFVMTRSPRHIRTRHVLYEMECTITLCIPRPDADAWKTTSRMRHIRGFTTNHQLLDRMDGWTPTRSQEHKYWYHAHVHMTYEIYYKTLVSSTGTIL